MPPDSTGAAGSGRPGRDVAGALRQVLPAGTVLTPGGDGYRDATSPDNTSFAQRPDAVVRPRSAGDVAAAVGAARDTGSRVMVQATVRAGREGRLALDAHADSTLTTGRPVAPSRPAMRCALAMPSPTLATTVRSMSW